MKNDTSEHNEPESNDADENEHLLQANEQLQAQLSATQQQLASLSLALSTSLAAQHRSSGETLVWFGEGTAKRWINARSVRMLSLQEGMKINSYEESSLAGPSGTFAVFADELALTAYHPAAEATQALDQVATILIQAMQPPER